MNSTFTRSIAYMALACLFLAAGLWRAAEHQPLLAGGPEAPIDQADIQITVDEIVASGFSRPVQVTHAGDGSGRLFVVEQTGYIRIIHTRRVAL